MHSSSPKIDLKPSMSGFYKIEAVDKDTLERRVVADWFPNLITDNGLNAFGTKGVLARCMVGSGANPPTVSDTILQTQIAVTTTVTVSTQSAATTAPYYGSTLRTYRFDAGVAAGNLSEVGIGWLDVGTSYCFSRALILDSGGFPTTITILSNEFLDVTYELRCYVPTSDVVTSITLAGTSYTCTIRPMQATVAAYWSPPATTPITASPSSPNSSAYAGPISALVTGSPSGTTGAGSNTAIAYENNSLTRKGYAEFALGSANFGGGIQSISFYTNGVGVYQVGFSPTIPKDITKTFRFDYGVSWARR
jgi:hypothetical protein